MLPDAVQRTGARSCPEEFTVETSEVVFYGEARLKGAERNVVTSLQSCFEVSSSEAV